MKRDVIIIGGGVVGLMTAYSLQKAGRSVTIIDEADISDCTSFGNAGLLSAFDKTPLSNPGVVLDTLKLMIKGESPVNIECKVVEVKKLGSHDMFIAEVVNVTVDDRYMDENNKFNLNDSDLVAYSHGEYFTLGEKIGTFGYSVRKK